MTACLSCAFAYLDAMCGCTVCCGAVGPYLCSALLIDKIVGWGRRRVCLVFCVALRGFWLFFDCVSRWRVWMLCLAVYGVLYNPTCGGNC